MTFRPGRIVGARPEVFRDGPVRSIWRPGLERRVGRNAGTSPSSNLLVESVVWPNARLGWSVRHWSAWDLCV